MEVASITGEEFQLLQDNLIQLKNTNYELEDKCKKQQKEIVLLEGRLRSVEDELQKAGSSKQAFQALLRGKNPLKHAESADSLGQEAEKLRQKLGSQEEEFRLQNQTLIEECQRLVLVNDDLQKKLQICCNNSAPSTELIEKTPVSIDGDLSGQLQEEIAKLKSELTNLRALKEKLETELQQAKTSESLANVIAEENILRLEKANSEIAALKDKELQKQKNADEQSNREKELEDRCLELRSSLAQYAEQLESVQIQAQETMSANDCLSQQLQDARNDVKHFQEVASEANKIAENRKSLMDEMARHVEDIKADKVKELTEQSVRLQAQIGSLREELELERASSSQLDEAKGQIAKLQAELSSVLERKNEVQQRAHQLETQLELSAVQHEEALESVQREWNERFQIEVERVETVVEELKHSLAASESKVEEQSNAITQLKQELKDRIHDLTVMEKKNAAMLKDLKRQTVSEKKRADKLQDKLLELSKTQGDTSRNRTPVSDDSFKILDSSADRFLRVNPDTSSVSSWSVVSGNGREHREGSDKRSSNHENDVESITSEGTLEQENENLISRLAELQRIKWELEEKVQLLEGNNSVLAETVANKTAIIEQFVREKPGINVANNSQTFKENLPPGLKKVIDFVKVDQNDMKEMNKRLQLMLEETITKNLHLAKDLEMMSKELEVMKSQQR